MFNLSGIQIQHLLKLNMTQKPTMTEIIDSNTTLVKVKCATLKDGKLVSGKFKYNTC